MSIEAQLTVTVASVEVGDDYRVELRVWRKVTDLHPDEAVQLAEELVAAAESSRRMFTEDFPLVDAQHGLRAVHGFDVDGSAVGREDGVMDRVRLLHPECVAGKHGNCDGITLDPADRWLPCECECHEAVAEDAA